MIDLSQGLGYFSTHRMKSRHVRIRAVAIFTGLVAAASTGLVDMMICALTAVFLMVLTAVFRITVFLPECHAR